jgi:hypothetical protein
MNDFDNKASEWDTNPMHWARSEAVATESKQFDVFIMSGKRY